MKMLRPAHQGKLPFWLSAKSQSPRESLQLVKFYMSIPSLNQLWARERNGLIQPSTPRKGGNGTMDNFPKRDTKATI